VSKGNGNETERYTARSVDGPIDQELSAKCSSGSSVPCKLTLTDGHGKVVAEGVETRELADGGHMKRNYRLSSPVDEHLLGTLDIDEQWQNNHVVANGKIERPDDE
jgi:hypothetical protein